MTTEQTIQEALQTIFQGMDEFGNDDVVINDWSVLDNPIEDSPYIIISNSDDFEASQPGKTQVTDWAIHITIFQQFSEWSTSFNLFRDSRQAIISVMVDGNRTLGLPGLNLKTIENEGPIEPYFEPYLTPEEIQEAIPIFIFQRFIFNFEEF
jgi:hypothetical protein